MRGVGHLKCRALVVERPGKMQMREFRVPEVGPREMLLKVELVSICGGEPKKYLGSSLWSRESRGLPYPLILGHEVVGYLEKVGEEASALHAVKPGDRVVVEPYISCGRCWYCGHGHYQLCRNRVIYGTSKSCDEPPHLWGAYAEYLFIPEGAKVHKIADHVPAEAACLVSVVGNGLRWTKTKGQLEWGQSIAILGVGAQGLATVIGAREVGAKLIIVFGLRRDAMRLALAKEYGATHVFEVENVDPVAAVRDVTGGEMVDVVVECSGSPEAIALAPSLLRPLGRCVLVGTVGGGGRVAITTDTVILGELTVCGGLGQAWNCEDAARLVNSGKYPVEKMITHEFPLEQGEAALRFFMEGTPNCIRVALRP